MCSRSADKYFRFQILAKSLSLAQVRRAPGWRRLSNNRWDPNWLVKNSPAGLTFRKIVFAKLEKIHLHPGRPAGVNEPTEKGVEGSREILNIVSQLSANDLCLVLISGGGSALLPAPTPPLTLQDKLVTTRFLMNHGAEIQELNAVRKRLSSIKGGGLAKASKAGNLIALIISDIVGDPLDMIASGPTVEDPTTDAEALAVLEKFHAGPPEVPNAVLDFLKNASHENRETEPFPENVSNVIIGNNQSALEVAQAKATELGYQVSSLGSNNAGEACQIGRDLVRRCHDLQKSAQIKLPVCLLSGGEPIVHLAETDLPRKGGRNQELVLAGMMELAETGMNNMVLLSGGTDGEDGPTDAAGAWADQNILDQAKRRGLDMRTYLEINNSYPFFEQIGGLLITGPTHTNVMDLRVCLVGRD